MGTWIIYASDRQVEAQDWDKFERGLEKSGFRISCPPGMTERSKRAFITVRDPKGKLDDWVLGHKRLDLLGQRVRALIRRFNEHVGKEKNNERRD